MSPNFPDTLKAILETLGAGGVWSLVFLYTLACLSAGVGVCATGRPFFEALIDAKKKAAMKDEAETAALQEMVRESLKSNVRKTGEH